MFKKEAESSRIQDHTEIIENQKTSVIGRSMKLKGNISAEEEILIEGKVEGTIKMKHNVIVGETGKVKADITAREIIIKGEVTGNVHGNVKVEIVPGGILNGDIISEKVVLAEGAKFKGNIDMSVSQEETVKKIKPVKEPEKPEKKN
jgi:cytoskeletal protein CcmA (bactofilin family)